MAPEVFRHEPYNNKVGVWVRVQCVRTCACVWCVRAYGCACVRRCACVDVCISVCWRREVPLSSVALPQGPHTYQGGEVCAL